MQKCEVTRGKDISIYLPFEVESNEAKIKQQSFMQHVPSMVVSNSSANEPKYTAVLVQQ